MKKVILIILAVALVIGVGLKIKAKMTQEALLQQEATQGKDKFKSNMTVVKVIELKPQAIKEILNVSGEIKSETEVAVQPRTSGRLVATLVDEGQAVRANQLLAVMDDETTRLQLQQSEANIAIIQANLSQAELNVNRSKTEKERYEELLKQKYIAQREYDNVENAYLAAKTALEAQKAQLTASQKNYEILKLQLNQTKIYSPVTGYVIKKQATEGMNLTTGSTIFTVASLNQVSLVFSIDQQDAVKLRRGMKASFSTDAFPDQEFNGLIREVNPSFDPLTRSITQKVVLSNRGAKLMPGMFGEVAMAIGGKEDALVVPQEAIVTQGGQNGVFVVMKDKTVQFKPVQTGLSADGKVEMTTGVKEGDLVVVMGQNRLRDGQEVAVEKNRDNGKGKDDKGKGDKKGNQDSAVQKKDVQTKTDNKARKEGGGK